jgi:hypothetical protein
MSQTNESVQQEPLIEISKEELEVLRAKCEKAINECPYYIEKWKWPKDDIAYSVSRVQRDFLQLLLSLHGIELSLNHLGNKLPLGVGSGKKVFRIES